MWTSFICSVSIYWVPTLGRCLIKWWVIFYSFQSLLSMKLIYYSSLLSTKCVFGFMLTSKNICYRRFFQDTFSFSNFEQYIELQVLFGLLQNSVRLTCSIDPMQHCSYGNRNMSLCKGLLEAWLTPNSFLHNNVRVLYPNFCMHTH